MIAAEIQHPSELSASDTATWSALQARTPAFASPLLGPDFAAAVGEVRDDARVAIWRNASGVANGFLAHHRRPTGFARPIGAPLSDYHAVVSTPDFGLGVGEILQTARLRAFRYAGLVDPFGLFAEATVTRTDGYRVDLAVPAQNRQPIPKSANALKNFRRYSRKLEREFGPLRLIADTEAAAFDRLLAWKRAQLQRTGLHDFLRAGWTRELLQRLFTRHVEPQGNGGFGGLMLNLYAGERHVAGHFGVRSAAHYHPWIGAMDPEAEAYAPGFVHQWAALSAMAELGLEVYDLGPGSDHWKKSVASAAIAVGAGLGTAPDLGGRLAGVSERLWTLAPLNGSPLAGRLRNRLDQIAAMELTVGGRMRGVLDAASGFERRQATRRAPDEARDAE